MSTTTKIIRPVFYLILSSLIVIIFLTYSYSKKILIPDDVLGKHVDVAGVKLRVYQTGHGPDVLFIHASIGNLEDFESVLPYLNNYRVTMFDRMGHGYSEMAHQTANISNNAKHISALIKTLGLKKVTIVGHSYGGSVALKMALNKDPNIHSMVLLAPAAYSLTPTSKLEHLLAKPIIGLGLIHLFRPFIAEQRLRKSLLTSLTPNQSLLPKDFINKRIKLWNNPGVLYTRTQQTNEVTEELNEMQKHYNNINRPVTIIIGNDEQHLDIAKGCKLLNDKLTQSELIVIKGAGHYLQYKGPHIISETIKKAAL